MHPGKDILPACLFTLELAHSSLPCVLVGFACAVLSSVFWLGHLNKAFVEQQDRFTCVEELATDLVRE